MINLNRRQFLQAGTIGIATTFLSPIVACSMSPASTVRIAFLHLAPRAGDLAYNRQLIESAIKTAARGGAQWILTPELCVCGYTFADQIGTEWIMPQPDAWMTPLCQLIAQLKVTVFLSHPERDPQTTQLYNSVFVIGANGAILGKHRKVNTLRVGSEAWSSPGEQVTPILLPPLRRIGVLICADAYSPGIARSLHTQGAELLVSSAAWAPGLHGPNGEWERCTRDTGLPLFVCNRTGLDRTLNFTEAESVIVKDGVRLLSLRTDRAALFFVEWNLHTQTLITPEFQTMYL